MSLKEIKSTTANTFLKVGQGRLIFDSDLVSETQATFRSRKIIKLGTQ